MKSILLLLTAVFFWALNFYLAKVMMEDVTPNVSAFWRYLFAVVTLFALTYFNLPSWVTIRENLKGIVLVGFIGLFGFIYFFFQGLKYTSEMNGALIVSLNPATTLILAVVLQGYKPNIREILGVTMALFGVLFLLTKGSIAAIQSVDFNKGDILFLIANLFFALQNIWIKKYSANLGRLNFTALTNLCCLIGFIGLLFFEPVFAPSTLPLKFWAAALGMGVFGTALSYYCWNYGISQAGATRGAIFINALPLFIAFFAIFFGASLFGYHLISFLLIFSGLLLVQYKGIRPAFLIKK